MCSRRRPGAMRRWWIGMEENWGNWAACGLPTRRRRCRSSRRGFWRLMKTRRGAGSGVCYAYFDKAEAAGAAVKQMRNAIIEFAPEDRKTKLKLWPNPGPDFEIMKRIKQMFDPEHLLNRGRLYRQL